MFIAARECHHRSVLKAVSWRALGSLDTFVLSYFITGNFVFAGSIATAETVTKVFLYYAHERAWSVLPWGQKLPERDSQKASTWTRVIGTATAALRHRASRAATVLRLPHAAAIAAFCLCFAVVLSPSSFVEQRGFARPASDRPAPRIARAEPRETAREPVTVVEATPAPPALPEAQEIVPHLIENAVATVPAAATDVPTTAALAHDEVRPAALNSDSRSEPPLQISRRDLSRSEHVIEVQEKLAALGFFSASPIGIWGPRSRQALRAFKEAHQLGVDDVWDEHTEQVLFDTATKPAGNFVGTWAVDASACSPASGQRDFVPAVIRPDGARAGETECLFDSITRESGAWTVSATCSNKRERWKTTVRLLAEGSRLTWTSKRGTQTYLRCGADMQVAGLR